MEGRLRYDRRTPEDVKEEGRSEGYLNQATDTLAEEVKSAFVRRYVLAGMRGEVRAICRTDMASVTHRYTIPLRRRRMGGDTCWRHGSGRYKADRMAHLR